MNPHSGGMEMPGKSRRSTIIIVVLAFLLVAVIAFGAWAFSQATANKNDANKKVAAAVAVTKTNEDAKITLQFQDQIKQPYKTYTSSPTMGSINFNYPKSYSAYVDETSSDEPINAYFYPNQVPGLESNTAFALRTELVTKAYSDVLDEYSSAIKDGSIKAAAYIPPKMTNVKNVQVGTMLNGVLGKDKQDNDQTGAMLIIPVRDKTLKIYTQSTNFLGDFNDIVLPSLTFVP